MAAPTDPSASIVRGSTWSGGTSAPACASAAAMSSGLSGESRRVRHRERIVGKSRAGW